MPDDKPSEQVPEAQDDKHADCDCKPSEQDAVPDDSHESQSLEDLLEKEKQNVRDCNDKLRHALADFQNLSRRTQADIENGINAKVDELLIEFLKIHDDFERAKKALSESTADMEGMNSILKNMDSLLTRYGVRPIDALGEIFNPNMHEAALPPVYNPDLDDNTITKEIRKGYISRDKVIRPTLVEISKKTKVD